MRARLILFCLGFLLPSPARSGEAENATIDSWYTALAAVDRAAFARLLADDAKVTLGDLDIVQTKVEFLASLDEWEDAMKGSTIRHAIESESGGLISVLVCYTFPDNESLTREAFSFAGGRIATSEQETISDTCADFPK